MNNVITKLSQSFFLVWRQRNFSSSLNSPLTSLYVKTKGLTLDLLCLLLLSHLCLSSKFLTSFLILVSKHMYTLQKPQGWWSVVWDGKKWGLLHMLMCSYVHFCFVCEHLFTFQFSALMPKISKENFAEACVNCVLKFNFLLNNLFSKVLATLRLTDTGIKYNGILWV